MTVSGLPHSQDASARHRSDGVRSTCDQEAGLGAEGTSSGINIEPGSNDDGWVVPPPVKLSDGTTVQLYKDGEALHAAYEAMNGAKRRICLESYIFADDTTGRAISDLLCAKARDGVRVYVIYDSFGSHSLSVLWTPKSPMFRKMVQNGVRLQEFHPVRPWEGRFSWKPVIRNHRKLLVVDDDAGGLGGLNVGREYAGSWIAQDDSCEPWRDNAIGLRGPAVGALLGAFRATWNYCIHGGRARRAEYLHNLDGQEPFALLASVPTMVSPLRPLLCNLLKEARSSVELTMAYFAPDDELIKELVRASKRGARVRLMLPGRSDVKALIIAAQSYYERLMDAKIEIYERQSAVLHAKTLVIDGKTSVLGSANLDTRSIEYNLELSAVIRSEPFGRQMRTLFQNDVRYAKQIDPTAWRRRPWRDRFGQWAVSRARYLL